MNEQRVSAGALDDGADGGPVQPDHEVAFPVPGDRAILNLGGPLAEHDLGGDVTRAGFAYVDARLANSEVVPLLRLRYGGSASSWGVALYRAGTGKYED